MSIEQDQLLPGGARSPMLAADKWLSVLGMGDWESGSSESWVPSHNDGGWVDGWMDGVSVSLGCSNK